LPPYKSNVITVHPARMARARVVGAAVAVVESGAVAAVAVAGQR